MSGHPTAFQTTPFARYADRAQAGLSRHFGGLGPGSLRSNSPPRVTELAAFNYWWLAHAVEVRVDAYERSGWSGWLVLARQTYAGIRRRNRGSLFNSYFDDMSWLALAALRLFDATAEQQYLRDANALWQRIAQRGAAAADAGHGKAVAWRVSQPSYLNAPTNGAFGIVSERLYERGGGGVTAQFADSSRTFLENTLRDEQTALIADGLNRAGDGRIDTDWLFSYNQGLYLGLKTLAFRRTGDTVHLDDAVGTALATVEQLTDSGVFTNENVNHQARGGGDVGLFKGIFYRYLADLLCVPELRDRTSSADSTGLAAPVAALESALRHATDLLWQTFSPSLLAADDWREFATAPVALSTELSAVMALEARSRFETTIAAAAS
ncbi:glycoside hydrolase family 76 protein [Subtercola endophyticus]|uniref:glycoside hydrolase family 76 protein n=1 Tax=Subtercola endophyticus TaxID=2895559 RepID=UPI001E3B18B8|nr:glycoside hydrolase family 76 protein [Subtercola endophyticus]UFS59849.1 hypothetical protein LQ955_03375 [Subtercola endophyticus]